MAKTIITKERKAQLLKTTKFKPPKAEVLLRNRNLVRAVAKDKEVVQMVIRGDTYDAIAQELGVSAKDAFDISRKAIDRWTKEFGLELAEAKELDAKRLDALQVLVWKDLEPKPLMDAKGCIVTNPLTGDVIYAPVDKSAIKLSLEILERRAKLYGLDAAQRMETKKEVEIVERRYIGVRVESL